MTTTSSDHEEKFREAACNGDVESLTKLLDSLSVDVNSQNKVNGWSALHWAAKRNHKAVIEFLLNKGADKNLTTAKGEKPVDLTTSEEVYNLLGGGGSRPILLKSDAQQAFTPNYLANPVFPYTQPVVSTSGTAEPKKTHQESIRVNGLSNTMSSPNDELVLKIRVAYLDEKDFIEVEMDRSNLTFEALKSIMCKELGVERRLINKIRKLPNTILRKDKDVQRLCDFQELEVVLTNKIPNQNTGARGLATPLKNQEVLY